MESDASSSPANVHKVNSDENGLQRSTPPLVDDQSKKVITSITPPTAKTVKRSLKFRGVARNRKTGRYEANFWDKWYCVATQKKKGKQVYIGSYDEEISAARAHDLAAIKCLGKSALTNFPATEYEKDEEMMENTTNEEYLSSLRRKSDAFSRGKSKYKGVSRHHKITGRWEARIASGYGKYIFLGIFGTQEEAARAYDIAAIKHKGINAVTNFELSTYSRSGSNSVSNVPSDTEDQPVPPPTTTTRE